MDRNTSNLECWPGKFVARSGVYCIFHAGHKNPHSILFLQGDYFPPCQECGDKVRFKLQAPTYWTVHDIDRRLPDWRPVI